MTQLISFGHDPLAVLDPLVEGRLPQDVPAGEYVVEVPPDDSLAGSARGHVLTST
jgi:hypothetical protein